MLRSSNLVEKNHLRRLFLRGNQDQSHPKVEASRSEGQGFKRYLLGVALAGRGWEMFQILQPCDNDATLPSSDIGNGVSTESCSIQVPE
jgi:hypothetical protein